MVTLLNNNSLKIGFHRLMIKIKIIHPCLLKNTGNSVKQARSKDGKKSVEQYNASKRFDVLSIGDVEKLVKKRKTKDEPSLYFTPNEEQYSKIKEHHVQQGHGGINKIMAHILLS